MPARKASALEPGGPPAAWLGRGPESAVLVNSNQVAALREANHGARVPWSPSMPARARSGPDSPVQLPASIFSFASRPVIGIVHPSRVPRRHEPACSSPRERNDIEPPGGIPCRAAAASVPPLAVRRRWIGGCESSALRPDRLRPCDLVRPFPLRNRRLPSALWRARAANTTSSVGVWVGHIAGDHRRDR